MNELESTVEQIVGQPAVHDALHVLEQETGIRVQGLMFSVGVACYLAGVKRAVSMASAKEGIDAYMMGLILRIVTAEATHIVKRSSE